jgi:hypothetical protein
MERCRLCYRHPSKQVPVPTYYRRAGGVCAVAPGRAKHPTGGAIWRIDAPNDDLVGAACARQACQFIPVGPRQVIKVPQRRRIPCATAGLAFCEHWRRHASSACATAARGFLAEGCSIRERGCVESAHPGGPKSCWKGRYGICRLFCQKQCVAVRCSPSQMLVRGRNIETKLPLPCIECINIDPRCLACFVFAR